MIRSRPLPGSCAVLYKTCGIGLLYVVWMQQGGHTALFFLALFLLAMTLVRIRFRRCAWSLFVDQAACILLAVLLGRGEYALVLIFFEAFYRKAYAIALPSLLYMVLNPAPVLILLSVQGAAAGAFLGAWAAERIKAAAQTDEITSRLYEMEQMQNDLLASGAQIAKMTETAERARIAREIHDKAGHEIVAAYISLQTARQLMGDESPEALSLYDDALKRLEEGIGKIRDTVHNLAPLTVSGIDSLRSLCERFTFCPVSFAVYGRTADIPIPVWHVLEACMNEALTNVMRHSRATTVTVSLDVTGHIARLCIQNDGAKKTTRNMGIGLRNLRYRAAAAGGSLSVEVGEQFRLICVLPLGNEVEP